MKCSKRRCPMQHDRISDNCDVKTCQYRTEDIDPQEIVRTFCNHIADLVVQKLRAESEDNNADSN